MKFARCSKLDFFCMFSRERRARANLNCNIRFVLINSVVVYVLIDFRMWSYGCFIVNSSCRAVNSVVYDTPRETISLQPRIVNWVENHLINIHIISEIKEVFRTLFKKCFTYSCIYHTHTCEEEQRFACDCNLNKM